MQRKIIPAVLGLALIISVSISLACIHTLQGNARVINYAGVVRGGTQRLIKQELAHEPDDVLIGYLDSLLEELSTGSGENGLIRLNSNEFQRIISVMQDDWEELKAEIGRVRQGGDGSELFRLSEDYFELANTAVEEAEKYTEKRVYQTRQIMGFVVVAFGAACILLAWIGWRQNKRREALRQQEDENRERSSYLSKISRELRAPMDEISELMYVSDMDTYELLFLNEAGRRNFGIEDFTGRKCYDLLQGRKTPCPFCTNEHLIPGENYTWEYTNPLTKRHYLLKDRIIEWEGRPARMEIAFDTTESEMEKQQLKFTLDAEKMVMGSVQILYQGQDLAAGVTEVLKRLGSFLSAERAYLFFIRDGRMYNDFEWCAMGVIPQQEQLQGMPESLIDRWRSVFSKNECVIVEDVEKLKDTSPEEYRVLTMQNIRSLVAAPMEQDGKLKGYLGVDNPPPQRLQNIASLLQTLCYFLMLSYRRADNEQQLSRLSFYDTLTTFYNRNRYIQDLKALTHECAPLGIVFLDVNGLKEINDRYGHAFGDKVLQESAQKMREVFGDAEYYRIGGDEFVILSNNISSDLFADRVKQLKQCFHADQNCKAAIGSCWTETVEDIGRIVGDADSRMYEDKKDYYRRHPSTVRYRHESDEVLPLTDPKVLQDKISKEQFVVYFQPKVSSDAGNTVGAEALIRYQPREGALVLPGNFLPLLEEAGSVMQIDFFVFEFVCSKLKKWVNEGKKAFPVSVNFSRASLTGPGFVKRLVDISEKYTISPNYLEIEITESMRDAKDFELKELIEELRRAGFAVAIDDFGTEYANLSLLTAVDFDVLKLDKTMVDDVADNPKTRRIVKTIAQLCREMGIKLIAEGIEKEEQLTALKGCGVELVQGYLFSRPIPIEEYEKKYL